MPPRSEWKGFYSTSQVARLAGIPRDTLYDWKSRGIIRPSVQLTDGDRLVDEGYSYPDLTIIKILRALRADNIDLVSAGVALSHLYERLGPPSSGWANANVYLVANRIYADKQDEWEATSATQFGQKVATVLFGDLFLELRNAEEHGSILIPQEFSSFVEIDPNTMGGQPVVRGTRVPTSVLAILKEEGNSIALIAQLYSPIQRKTIEKAIEYEEFLDRSAA